MLESMERKSECEDPCLPSSGRPTDGATVYYPSPARTPTAPLLPESEHVLPSYQTRYVNDMAMQKPYTANTPNYSQRLPITPHGHGSGYGAPPGAWNSPPLEGAANFNNPPQQHVRQADGYPPPGVVYHAGDCQVDVSVPDVPPPSYGFVTQTGMQQFQEGLPPVNPINPQTVEKEDNSACACCQCMVSFVGHAGFLICLGFLIKESLSPSRSSAPVYICAAFLVISYIIIIIEACCSNTKTYLENFTKIPELKQYVGGLQNARPTISWHVDCYHYETRYRTVSYRDGRGNTRYRTESYQEKVTTHSESREYQFNRWRDVTGDLPFFPPGTVTRLHLSSSYNFIDESSSSNYNLLKDQFHDENVNRDKHMSFTESYDVEGLKDRLTVYDHEGARQFCMKERWFWLTTLLLVNSCYRYWFSSSTSKAYFNIAKEVGV